MSFAKIRPRRGTATQWSTANPILVEGEIGIEVPNDGVGTGAVKIKFGDGVRAWNDLPYGISEIVDNLSSESTVSPLSANQGKVLNDMIQQSLIYHGEIPSDANYETLAIGVWYEKVGNDTYGIPQNSMLYKSISTSLSGSFVVCFMANSNYGIYTLNKAKNKYEKLAGKNELPVLKSKTVSGTTSQFGNTPGSLLNSDEIFDSCSLTKPSSNHYLAPAYFNGQKVFSLHNGANTDKSAMANTAYEGTIWYWKLTT